MLRSKKPRLAVFFSGGGTNFQCLIDGVKDNSIDAEIVLAVSSNSEAGAIERAGRENIPVFVAELKNYPCPNCRDNAILAELLKAKVDYVFLCGYLGIVTPSLLKKYAGKIINIHPALLPKHGGKGMFGINVHRAVLASGDKVTGATVHFVDEGTDTGAIIMQRSVDVVAGESAEQLQQRVLECEHTILPEAARLICAGKVKLVRGKVLIKS